MKLLSAYALASGQKIQKINVVPKYFPLPFSKYISFAPVSKSSKTYSFWSSVLDLIAPILHQNGISIVQIGGANEPGFNHCHHTQGKTSILQSCYIIKNALLHVGVDSFGQHYAASENIPLVNLISNNYKNCVEPYFGDDKSKQIILEPPDRDKIKPSFSFEEPPGQKQIDKIKPELIAKSVCKLLDLNLDFPYETLFFGCFYNNKIVEMVPSQAISLQNLGIDNMIVRMDFLFNESVLAHQLNISNCSIITEKPISLDLIKQFQSKIKQLIYIIDKDYDLKFIDFLHKNGINYVLVSHLSEEELNPLKLNFLDYNMVIRKDKIHPEYNKKLDNFTELHYSSNKFTLADGKIYPSKAACLEKKEISSLTNIIVPAILSEDWKSELEYYWVLKKI